MSVLTVGNSLDIVQSFSDIRNFTVLNKSGIHVMVSRGRVLGIWPRIEAQEQFLEGRIKETLDTILRRIFPEMEVGIWRMQSLLQVGIWEYRIGRKSYFSEKSWLLAIPLPRHSNSWRYHLLS